MGEEGSVRLVKDVLETTRLIAGGVREIEGLRLIGDAAAMIVCFAGDGCNVYSVSDAMRRRGWTLNSLQNPAAVHLCVTGCHVGRAEEFLRDLRSCTEEVRSQPQNGSGQAAVYGATATLPAGPINELLCVYNDVVLRV